MDAGLLTTGFNCVLQMPTGSGKTWLALQAIRHTRDEGLRAVYLTPLRALANEIGERWARELPASVGVFTGETLEHTDTRSFSRSRVLVMTPERLDACTRHWRAHWSWLPEVALVVVDELHLLGDPHRGGRLEGALGRLRRLNPMLRVLGLSATLGNRSELAEWLGGVEHASHWRAVPLAWRVRRFRKFQEKPAQLAAEVGAVQQGNGRTLVFVQSRRRAEQLAESLSSQGIPTLHHHAGLGRRERLAAEARMRAGELGCLVSTGTLEMGLNLPVRKVILYDLQRFNGADYEPLAVNTVWQRAGRAGRPGLDTEGEVVLFAPAWDRQAAAYEQGRFEPVRSALLRPQPLAEQILAEVGSGLCRSRTQLRRALSTSLAARQGLSAARVDESLRKMVEAGMLEESEEDRGSRLKATRLGRIAVRQMLSPDSVLHLARLAQHERRDAFTLFDILLICVSAPDCEPRLPADFEELDDLGAQLTREPSQLLRRGVPELTPMLACRGKALLAAFKGALVARSWTRAGAVAPVADAFCCYPFEVERLRESLGRLLQALVAMTTAPSTETPSGQEAEDASHTGLRERARALAAMVQHGVDEEVVTLTTLPGVGGILARRLADADIGDLEALAQAEPVEVAGVRGISADRARALIEDAEFALQTGGAWRLHEAVLAGGVEHATWPEGIDPYRLGRARELRVERTGAGRYRVTGGQEPHQVRSAPAPLCDCPDFAGGHRCKHLIAVGLAEHDPALLEARRIFETQAPDKLNLHQLWYEGGGRHR